MERASGSFSEMHFWAAHRLHKKNPPLPLIVGLACTAYLHYWQLLDKTILFSTDNFAINTKQISQQRGPYPLPGVTWHGKKSRDHISGTFCLDNLLGYSTTHCGRKNQCIESRPEGICYCIFYAVVKCLPRGEHRSTRWLLIIFYKSALLLFHKLLYTEVPFSKSRSSLPRKFAT